MKTKLLATIALLCAGLTNGHAADWPTFLNGNDRVGATADKLPEQIELKWVYSTPAPPEMAWAGPRAEPVEGKYMRHRVAFDRAIDVVVANDRVYFGSPVDNKIYCMNAATGEPIWSVFTDGAIRLAPTVWKGKVYVGSDDGHAYCLDAADGKLIWKLRAGTSDERLLARGEMISRWPLRTGILIYDGIAYFGAGVFPHETVYLYAVDAETGSVVWKNDRISQEDAGRNPLSPQGYLLATDELLIVPSGRALPAAFDRRTGEELHQRNHSWRSTAGGVVGGTKALLADGQIYSAGDHHFLAMDQKSGGTGFAWINGRQLAISEDLGFVATSTQLVAIKRAEHAKATVERQDLNLKLDSLRGKRSSMKAEEYQTQVAELEAKIAELSKVGTLWNVETPLASSLIFAGGTVVVGGENQVAAYNAQTGAPLWTQPVEGDLHSLAASNGNFFASTDRGKIYGFGGVNAASPGKEPAKLPADYIAEPYAKDDLTEMYAAAADEIIRQTGVTRGFCLVLGSEKGRLAFELARRSDLQVYGIESDAKKADESRRALDRAGAYGHRVTIVEADLNALPFSNYFANLVVSDSLLLTGELPSRATEIARSIKPCGGIICLGAPPSAPAAAKITSEKLQAWLAGLNLAPDEKFASAGTFASLTRGKLSGVGEWSHQYGNVANTSTSSDYRVKGGMGVLWYGDPGPAPMINRHEAAAAPLSTNGRMFIQGLDSILCYDAYNGTFLWEYKNPGAIRTGVFNNEETSNLAASADALFVAVDDTCTEIDAATGKVRAVYKTPASEDKIPRVWGYVGYWNGMLFGTSTIRGDLEQSLRRRGHTVANTTDSIFAVDVKTGERKWVYRGKNIMHVTIAIGDDRAFFIDSSISQQQRDELLRQDKTELKNLGEEEAKKKEAELKALDVRLAVAVDINDGNVLWSQAVDVTDCSYVGIGGGQLTLIYQNGHVLICGANANGHYWRQFLSGQFSKRRLLVLDAKTGEKLWSKDANYRHRPIVVEDQIIAEPWSFALHTGEEKQRENPITGEETKWQFSRPGHHCGMITATPNTLFFRSGYTGYYDLYSDSGVSHFAGQRMGCWVNAIPGNGLLMIPEASAGCVCQFSIEATVVMEPRQEADTWKIASLSGSATPVKQLAINLGAPGDRRDTFGTLWLAFPRPATVGRLEYTFDIKPSLASGGGYYNYNSDSIQIENANTPWVLTSGVRGLSRCELELLGENDKPATYSVKLHFAQIEECAPGDAMFAIKLQGDTVAEKVDVVREAGATSRALVRTFDNIAVDKNLTIELVSQGEMLPTISAIEVVRK
ncbi:MAG: PQQ-binding-like beta-propeller repeat protein [Planctomycetota bacterium]|nr:PQQ-binding-like beta-propeller repeat protein [Planctomycetota bacterium]